MSSMNPLNWKISIAVGVVAVCIVAMYTISQTEQKEKEKIKPEKPANQTEKNRLMPLQKKENQLMAPQKKEFTPQQSPINIISKPKNFNLNIIHETKAKDKYIHDDEWHSNPLKILYPKQVKDCTIINNGHTVQINIPKHNNCILTVHDKKYCLKQFHFHIPSEHRIDDKQYEMEMHLVHVNEHNEIAVLGMIFTKKQKPFMAQLRKSRSGYHLTLKNSKNKNVQNSEAGCLTIASATSSDVSTDELSDPDSDSDSDNELPDIGNVFLDQFWQQLPPQKTEEEIVLKEAISFDYLFAASSSIGKFSKEVKTNEIMVEMELFEYIGSLTTPPYTEGVQWLVSKKLHHVNQKELNELGACWGHIHNARSVQDMHGSVHNLSMILSS